MTNKAFHTKSSEHVRLSARVLFLAFLSTCLLVSPALADVRKADVVMGETVEERDLTVANAPSIDADYALVMDSEGTVYFERDATKPTQIASITKVMTALVALDAAGDNLDREVVVTKEAAAIGESTAGLQADDKMTLKDALYALMVPSGNDAAMSIATSIGADFASGNTSAYDAFVGKMNEKAKELGCVDSKFENPHGLDDGENKGDQHSCAADVAKIVQAAMKDDTFRTIVKGGSTSIKVDRDGALTTVDLQTTDEFLDMYKYAIGVKTGFTDLAGPSFAGAAKKGKLELYAIIIHSSSEGQRFIDAQTLCQWVYDHMVSYKLANSEETTKMKIKGKTENVPVVAKVSHQDWVNRTIDATLQNPDKKIQVFDLNGNVSQTVQFDEVHGDVQPGDKLGTVTFKQRNNTIATANLIACKSVPAPGPLDAFGTWWDRFFRGFTNQPESADSILLNDTPLIIDKSKKTSSE